MTIRVRLFAVLRDRAGVAEVALPLPAGATVSDASNELSRRFPQIQPILPRTAFAINMSKAEASATLRDGDELALLPPVSGG